MSVCLSTGESTCDYSPPMPLVPPYHMRISRTTWELSATHGPVQTYSLGTLL